ncbi:MAG TPA: caspase family protein, partial [Segetibacter sp.]|jgi:hypothetical protein
MGSTDTALIRSYRRAYEKRVKKLGVDTASFGAGFGLPEADFTNREAVAFEQKEGKLKLQIKGSDTTNALDRFNVWINEVPLFGVKGISVRGKNVNNIDTVITVALSAGTNVIETSITNVNGTESYRMPLTVSYSPSQPYKERLHFIGIGIDQFKDSIQNLSWSVKDIRDLALKIKEKHNDVIIDTLFNGGVTNESVKNLKARLLNTTENDKVIVSYSGHGLLSKTYDYYLSTYDVNFNKPEEGGLAYEELEGLLDGIPARKKLMLIDACHSGELDKEEILKIEAQDSIRTKEGLITTKSNIKNVQKKVGMKNSFELMQQLFVNVGRSTGATIISAAGGTQFAQERGDLKNGVFTYSILEFMKNNTSATVSQMRAYVNKRVPELTKGLQVPTTRTETVALDWTFW